jgi:tetratricopeptide (TPR) repeat protein
MLLSLGAKETALALPAALLLLEGVAGPRPFSWRRALRGVAPHLAVLAAFAAAFLAAPTYRRMAARSLELREPWTNLLTHVQALGWLAGQVVRLDRLNADPALPAVDALSPSIALAGLGLLGALAAGLALLRRGPAVALGILWFLVWLPLAGWGLPRADPASERQLYLALLGPAWLAGLGLARWLAGGAGEGPASERFPDRGLQAAPGASTGSPSPAEAVATRFEGARRWLAGALALALVAALAAATALRNRVYRDEIAFWEDVVAKSPHSPRAHNNLGAALAARCRVAEAKASFERALEADPRHFRAAVNLELLSEGRSPPGSRLWCYEGVSPSSNATRRP